MIECLFAKSLLVSPCLVRPVTRVVCGHFGSGREREKGSSESGATLVAEKKGHTSKLAGRKTEY